MKTPVLITGATGFVGSHLVEALAREGVPVRALVRHGSDTALLRRVGAELVQGALGDPEALARAAAGAEVVLHLAAATSARSEAEYRRINADGTQALVRAVLAADPRPRRLVYLSSLAAVGPSDPGWPVGPDSPPRPLTAYGRTKLAGERACLAAGGDVEVAVLRAPAVYGPRDRELLRLFRYAAVGLLPVPSGPTRLVQLVHVMDLAEALVRGAMRPGAAGVFHVAEPRPYAWEEVVRLIAEAVGRPRARVVRVPAALLGAAGAASEWSARLVGRSSVFNREKVRELLAPGWLCETDALRRDVGFETRIPLARGLAETAAWYRAHGWL